MAELHDSNNQHLAPECQQTVLALDAYHDNELKEDERRSVERHLLSCESCKKSLEATKQVSAALQSVPKATMKRDMSNELDELLRKSNNVVWFKKPVVSGTIAAAAAVAALALAPMMLPGIAPSNVAKKPSELNPVRPANDSQMQPIAVQVKPDSAPAGQAPSGSTEPQIAKHTTTITPQIQHTQMDTQTATAQKPKTSAPVGTSSDKPQSTQLVAKNDGEMKPKIEASPATTDTIAATKVQVEEERSLQRLAYFGEAEQDSMDVGISTDEDGLYAIKL